MEYYGIKWFKKVFADIIKTLKKAYSFRDKIISLFFYKALFPVIGLIIKNYKEYQYSLFFHQRIFIE